MSQYDPNTSGGVLYVTTGIEAPKDDFFNAPYPDRLVAVDAKTGAIIAQAPIDKPQGISNEPHHIGVANNGNGVAFGGLLSVAHQLLFNKPHPDIFHFDITDRKHPKYVPGKDFTFNHTNPALPNYCAATDEFISLESAFFPKGTYAVSMMGSGDAGSPGKVAIFDKDDKLVGTYPDVYPDTNFNPHGIWYNAQADLLMTSDFVEPISVVIGPPVWRLTMRVWENFSVNKKITKTIKIDDPKVNGLMSVIMIPNHPKYWSYVCGSGHMYLLKPEEGTATLIFNFPVEFSGFITINKNGTRVTAPLMNDLAYINIDDPEHPYLSDLSSIKKYWKGDYQARYPTGCHYSKYTFDEKWMFSTNYFITTPIIENMGDRKLWRARVTQDEIINDPDFEVDFANFHPSEAPTTTIEARPHGIVIAYYSDKITTDHKVIPTVIDTQQICDASVSEIEAKLYKSIEGWLINAAAGVKLASDIKSTDLMNYTSSFNSLMVSCNIIGEAYDVLVGKETAAKIIRSIFMFSSQTAQVMADLVADRSSTYNLDLWTVRRRELAAMLTNVYYMDYKVINGILKSYQNSIHQWILEVLDDKKSYSTMLQVMKQARAIGEYIGNNQLVLREKVCQCVPKVCEIKYRGFRWFMYGVSLELYIYGGEWARSFVLISISNLTKYFKCEASALSKYLKELMVNIGNHAMSQATVGHISLILENCKHIQPIKSIPALMAYHDLYHMVHGAMMDVTFSTQSLELAQLF